MIRTELDLVRANGNAGRKAVDNPRDGATAERRATTIGAEHGELIAMNVRMRRYSIAVFFEIAF
jgi:hypothetical protein